MATATIALSSSPLRSPSATVPPSFTMGTMPSSPVLPSPSQLISRMPTQLTKGSNSVAIAEDAVTGFQSASALLRHARFEGGLELGSTAKRLGLKDRLDGQPLSKLSVQTSDTECPKENKEKPVFRHPEALVEEKCSVTTTEEPAVPDQPRPAIKLTDHTAPKKRARKKKAENGPKQAKIEKPKIIKVKTSGSNARSKKSAKGTTQAKKDKFETFNTLLPSQEEEAKAREEFQDLCLKKAIPLRRQWTPCKDTVPDPAFDCGPDPSVPAIRSPNTQKDITPVVNFGQLLDNFGFAKNADTTVLTGESCLQDPENKAVKKRKIEIVEGVSAPPKNEKQRRSKSPKKKPQTITEKATAPFVPADAVTAPSMLQYLSASAVPSNNVEMDKSKASKISSKDKRKTTSKKTPKVRVATTHKKTQAQPILLSPESALKRTESQDLCFGTSSQLAIEESPSVINDLEQAMRESASMSQGSQPSIPSGGTFRTSNLLASVYSRNLWAAASRDFENALLEADTVDLTETPKPPKSQVLPTPPANEVCFPAPQLCASEEHCSINVTKLPTSSEKLHFEPTHALKQAQESSLPRSVAEATLRKRPNNRSPEKNATNSKADPNQMPNYQGYTDAQLSREIAAYGFKPIKKRVAQIALLEQCWESKVSMAAQEVEANLNAHISAADTANPGTPKKTGPGRKKGRPPKKSTESTADGAEANMSPVKKRRGRPKKDGKATLSHSNCKEKTSDVVEAQLRNQPTADDEIYDSTPSTPSPPRRQSKSKSPRQLQLAKSRSKNSTDRLSKESQAQLFEQMTRAITTFPPTYDPKNLSFYEKILLYEPIVLEDLAAWLNTEGLPRSSEDDKFSPGLVKQWCESQSICCLWRENLRVGERGRW